MKQPPATSPGEVILLPQEFSSPSKEKSIVEYYKTLRLRGLQQEPEAFLSTYEEESQFPDETWAQRVKNPSAKTFVAVRNGPEDDTRDDISSKLNREWIGLCVLVGPRRLDPDRSDPEAAFWAFAPPTGDSNTESDPGDGAQLPLSYCAASMFVSPDQRGHGFGRKLIDAVIEYAQKQAKELSAPKAYLNISFETDNHLARQLYGKWGFTVMDDIEEFPDKSGKTRPMGWGWKPL